MEKQFKTIVFLLFMLLNLNLIQSCGFEDPMPCIDNCEETNEEELFKMLTSFYNISQLYYEEIPEKYKEKLVKLKEGKSHKIRFKIMDILDE